MEFSEEYPNKPPIVRFVSKMFHPNGLFLHFFMRKSSYCFQRILAIAILSVCLSVHLSVTRVDQSKTVQSKMTKSSSSDAWKTLVSETVNLFYKFEGDHPE